MTPSGCNTTRKSLKPSEERRFGPPIPRRSRGSVPGSGRVEGSAHLLISNGRQGLIGRREDAVAVGQQHLSLRQGERHRFLVVKCFAAPTRAEHHLIEAPTRSDPLGVPQLAVSSCELLVEIVRPAGNVEEMKADGGGGEVGLPA